MKKLISIAIAASFLVACNQSTTSDNKKAEDAKTETPKQAPSEVKPELSKQDQESYGIGAFQGDRMRKDIESYQNLGLNKEQVIKGFTDGINGANSLTAEELQEYIVGYQTRLQNEMKAQQAEKSKENKEKGAAFLENNKNAEGVKVTESGLQYKVVEAGDGKSFPKGEDVVKVHYTGKLTDGTKFDSSIDRGEPIEFALNRVIPGWTEGLQLMSVGSKYQLYIPSELGYGERELRVIPANSVLVFDVELLAINPEKKEETPTAK